MFEEDLTCQYVILGSLIKALAAENLFPLPSAQLYGESVESLARKLSRLEYRSFRLKNVSRSSYYTGPRDSDHSKCNPKESVTRYIREAHRNRGNVFNEVHAAHLERQARKVGRESQSHAS